MANVCDALALPLHSTLSVSSHLRPRFHTSSSPMFVILVNAQTASRYFKKGLEWIWLIVSFAALIAAPVAVYFVALHSLPDDTNSDDNNNNDRDRDRFDDDDQTLRQGALPRLVGTLRHGRSSIRTILPIAVALACFLFLLYGFAFGQGIKFWEAYSRAGLSPQAAAAVSRCRSIQAKPAPPLDFAKRSQSDRFAPGTKPILLKNAKIWTGEKNGTEVVHADILLDKGLIKGIGQTNLAKILKSYKDDIEVIDVKNAWVTPGIVDLHSHLGDASSPELDGASGDDNLLHGPILPWLRALDGLNTHDDSYRLSIAGDVTTALILPGSANAIGLFSETLETILQ
ncbi:hypothetical protein EW026_g6254 [Hermanssonia centrifuga]|uniref:Amidohydrolase-related domain-containing protein n=1 Tax=Hermanssonia centrifuga TaxID=98765 RepID=A0A4S4KBN0_9APHY|nr:hypothetical protein EW026_g6254 [Hermanssonia centrifuga]